jgi:hypothetical protein
MKLTGSPEWSKRLALCCVASALCTCGAAAAQARADGAVPVPVVEVLGAAQPRDEKPYRDLLAALDAVERYRSRAPAAAVRFKVWPRRAGVDMTGLEVRIVGSHTDIPVPLAADRTFAIPRDAAAAADDAVVRFNRKAGSLAWRADVRSPGVPDHARRLGDLMLECAADVKGDLFAYLHHPVNVLLSKLDDPCRTVPLNLFNFADRPVFGITLVAGDRRSMLPAAFLHGDAAVPFPDHEDWLAQRERVYKVKFKALYDAGWPDDTLLVFEDMDDGEGGP